MIFFVDWGSVWAERYMSGPSRICSFLLAGVGRDKGEQTMRKGFVLLTCMCLSCAAFGTSEREDIRQLPTIDVEAFTKLRMGYANLANFSPMWKLEAEREAVMDAYKSGNYEKFLSVSKEWLSKCPVDASVHRLRAHVCADKNAFDGYFSHMHFYYGLLASIAESGDGRAPETAMKVISVAEEYYVLRHIGATLIKQSLVDGGFDMMECEMDGEKITFFFNVSIALNAIGKEVGEQDDRESSGATGQGRLTQADVIFDADSETLDICEAVFRYQFEHNVSGIQQDAEGYFLSHLKNFSPDLRVRSRR